MPNFEYAYKFRTLTEIDVKHVANVCFNNSQCAIMCNVSLSTWKKYATLFREPETSLTYYEFVKQKHKRKKFTKKLNLESVFNGTVSLSDKTFKQRLISEGWILEACTCCGWNEKHLLTNKINLTLDFVDGDRKNKTLNNVQLLCYNCLHLMSNNYKIIVRQKK